MCRSLQFLVVAACVLQPHLALAQGLTGALIGTVKDAQGGALAGAVVRVSSPALIGGPAMLTTNEEGQLRFPALPPGPYVLDIQFQGFSPYHEEGIPIGAGATIERTAVLTLAGLAESVAVEGAGSRIEARDSGFMTRFGPEDLNAIPTRRVSMFDFIRAAPGVSPTSPGSATATTVSAFGSGTNENQFLIDGTNFTCPCSGIARAEPGVDFIQEVQVQSVGASAEFGGKPYAASAQLTLPQGTQRVLLEPPGSRRMSSQSLLDLRVSKTIAFGGVGRVEVLVDVLNALNDTAEEGLATDNLFSPNFGAATIFMDPRRAMVGVRLNLGR